MLQTGRTSTGQRQNVPLRLEDLVIGGVLVASSGRLGPADICCHAMPLSDDVLGGVVCTVLAPLLSGGAVLPMCVPDPHRFWARLEAHSATWFYVSPTRHAAIYQALEPASTSHSTLRLVLETKTSLWPSMGQAMRHRYSSAGNACVILPTYGTIECMPIAAPPEDYNLSTPGSCGSPLGPAVCIVDDMGVVKPPGCVGRIQLQGRPLVQGYERPSVSHARLRGPSETMLFDESGWFDTGDLGFLDEQGWLHVTSLAKAVKTDSADDHHLLLEEAKHNEVSSTSNAMPTS